MDPGIEKTISKLLSIQLSVLGDHWTEAVRLTSLSVLADFINLVKFSVMIMRYFPFLNCEESFSPILSFFYFFLPNTQKALFCRSFSSICGRKHHSWFVSH